MVSEIYFIAEIGINHNGDLNIAKKLIDASFACNWDCVKFQKRNPDVCVPDHQKDVVRQTPWGEMTYLNYKKNVPAVFPRTRPWEAQSQTKRNPLLKTLKTEKRTLQNVFLILALIYLKSQNILYWLKQHIFFYFS